MKRTIALLSSGLLPLGLAIAGCAAPAADNTAAEPAPGAAQSAAAPAADAKPTYRVLSDAVAGMSEAQRKAVLKAAVPPPPDSMPVPIKPTLVITTNKGPITIELDGKAAPLHVKSFVYLAGLKFFNGTTFHRYVPDFVIQGGDPLTRDEATRGVGGTGGPGYQIPREVNNLTHEQFAVAAARSSDPDSAGSQFYITLKDVHFLDPNYTVFGKVTKGQDVVLKLRQDDVMTSVELKPEPGKANAKP